MWRQQCFHNFGDFGDGSMFGFGNMACSPWGLAPSVLGVDMARANWTPPPAAHPAPSTDYVPANPTVATSSAPEHCHTHEPTEPSGVANQVSPSKTRCKFGKRCTRLDCWYQHPEGRNIDMPDSSARRSSRSPAPKRRRRLHRDSPSSLTPPCVRGAAAKPHNHCDDDSADDDRKDSDQGFSRTTSRSQPRGSRPHLLLRDADVPWPRVISSSGKLKNFTSLTRKVGLFTF